MVGRKQNEELTVITKTYGLILLSCLAFFGQAILLFQGWSFRVSKW